MDMALTERKSLHNERCCSTPSNSPPKYFAYRTVVSNQPYLVGKKQDETLGKQCEVPQKQDAAHEPECSHVC